MNRCEVVIFDQNSLVLLEVAHENSIKTPYHWVALNNMFIIICLKS